MSEQDRESSVFHPFKPGLRKLFGDLEAEIMDIAWSHPDQWMTVREILEILNQGQKQYAYTTIMTVMGNLAKKGALVSEKEGQAYRYQPSMSREDYTQSMVGKILDELMGDFSEPVLAHFAERMKGDLPKKLADRIKKAREQE